MEDTDISVEKITVGCHESNISILLKVKSSTSQSQPKTKGSAITTWMQNQAAASARNPSLHEGHVLNHPESKGTKITPRDESYFSSDYCTI